MHNRMNPLYGVWWRLLLSSRLVLRFWSERYPKFAPTGIRLRWLLHVLVGNPIQTVSCAIVLTMFRTQAGLTALVVIVAMVEVWFRLRFTAGGWVVSWRMAWWFRRGFPRWWADLAAKTARVQAEVGTSKEPISSAQMRPVADHPKMGWRPKVVWPVVSWWVGPPPGRSFLELDKNTTVLAANVPNAVEIDLTYTKETASWGRLHVSFVDVLADPRTPDWVPAEMTLTDTYGKPFQAPEYDELDQALADLELVPPLDDEDTSPVDKPHPGFGEVA